MDDQARPGVMVQVWHEIFKGAGKNMRTVGTRGSFHQRKDSQPSAVLGEGSGMNTKKVIIIIIIIRRKLKS